MALRSFVIIAFVVTHTSGCAPLSPLSKESSERSSFIEDSKEKRNKDEDPEILSPTPEPTAVPTVAPAETPVPAAKMHLPESRHYVGKMPDGSYVVAKAVGAFTYYSYAPDVAALDVLVATIDTSKDKLYDFREEMMSMSTILPPFETPGYKLGEKIVAEFGGSSAHPAVGRALLSLVSGCVVEEFSDHINVGKSGVGTISVYDAEFRSMLAMKASVRDRYIIDWRVMP